MVQHAHRSHFRLLCPESERTEGAKGGIALYTLLYKTKILRNLQDLRLEEKREDLQG